MIVIPGWLGGSGGAGLGAAPCPAPSRAGMREEVGAMES